MLSIRIFALLFIFLSLVLMHYGLGIKSEFSYEPLGPRPFPLATLALIALCNVLLLFFSEQTKIQWPSLKLLQSLAFLLLNFFCYAWAFEYLGFLFASAIFIFFVALIFGARVFPALVFAVLCSLALFCLFDTLMQITLPQGEIFA
ncbi:tripartite tricarboxylate transporter TctB family protein [Helicobacter mesocricetorum]|uniref:tripartite tricarboxylate transporter TctB family protein n=1 Tax=Helicobacter mesocricetorum TaxID=87012 RepID=UPI000CF10F1B|nr:tripartite tricarboxylate transporter TctB family protein [Helicobacter mesocricetorum]